MKALTMFDVKQQWKKIQLHFIWWALAMGALLLAGSGYLELAWPDWVITRQKMHDAGNAVLVSGVFASLLKSYQFAGLFQEELERFFIRPELTSKLREGPIVPGRQFDALLI